MKIVQVAPDYYPVPPHKYGGIERMIYSLTEELVRRGHDVYLFAPKGSVSSATIISYEHDTPSYEAITEFVLTHLPSDLDIIHDHTHASLIGQKRLPIPTICSIHDSRFNGVRHPVYLSKRARQVVGKGEGFFAYNGIDIHDYSCTDQKEEYLLFLGVLNWHKGVLQAIEVAEKTGEHLIIAGPVFNPDYYAKEIAPRLAANPNIRFIGEVGGEEKMQLLQKAKCMLFPTSWEEPFGLVMVEAMACGTPVLAFPNGAVPEVLAGFPELICASVDEMVAKLHTGAFPEAQAMQAYVAKHFSAEAMADQYEDIYRQVLQAKQAEAELDKSAVSRMDRSGLETLPATHLLQIAEQVRTWNHVTQAVSLYELVLQKESATALEKVVACERLADHYNHLGETGKERSYCLQSLQYDAPRAETCCRLGYSFLQNNQLQQAIFWYTLATTLQPPADRRYFYNAACWTWLPHLQLCVCHYRTGDYRKAYEHNERAYHYAPFENHIVANKKLLESMLHIESDDANATKEVQVANGIGSTFGMILKLPGLIEDHIIQSGYWEPHLARIICRFAHRDSLFLDIGANIGYHSLYTASSCPNTSCIAFEPHPAIFEQLQKSQAINDFANMVVHNLAVGDTSGTIDFYMQSENCYNRGMSGVKYYSGIGNDFTKIEVPVVALDDFLDEKDRKRVSVMKIDTQGFEYQVLLGSAAIIAQSRPVVLFEYHDNADDSLDNCLKLLPDYHAYKFQPFTGEIRRLDQPDPAHYMHDLLCVPPALVPEVEALLSTHHN